MHDWTRVSAGIFHDFRLSWISRVSGALNSEALPRGHYSMLQRPWVDSIFDDPAMTVVEYPTIDGDDSAAYARMADRLGIYREPEDRLVAFIEIVSPGNKHSEIARREFMGKWEETLVRGCHLLIIDPHPPTVRDPRGLHARFWIECVGQPDSPGVTDEKPLSVAAYRTDTVPTAYFTPFGVGEPVPDMPLFLDPDHYVNVPLEESYQAAWKTMPERWKRVIER